MSTEPTSQEITAIIEALGKGDARAADRLVPLLYDELHRRAADCLRGERRGHTLQPTALVNEAYLRLVGHEQQRWQDRAHFLAWASRIMRQVLVDHGRRHRARKRGGGKAREPLSHITVAIEESDAMDLEALDAALVKLAGIDERKSRIVEVRFFGGLSIEEAAKVLGISHATVEREWRFARAWLHREISGRERGAGDA
jgi:RNA polymerase sigma factor (TIGR02999 family)